MKKLIFVPVAALCIIMLASCAKDKAEDGKKAEGNVTVNTPALTQRATDAGIDVAESEEVATPMPTEEPVNEPTPTPYPTDKVKEYDNYGFTYKDNIHLRNSPETDGYVLSVLESGTEIHITGRVGDNWYRADVNGNNGYIKKTSVALSKAYINADEVKLRTGASRTRDIKKELSQQTELVIISKSDDWTRVVLMDEDNTTGYVYSDYVSYHDAYVTADDVRLREAPNSECKTITRIPHGKKVAIVGEYNGWYKVNVEEYSGYMSKDYIEYSAAVKKVDKKRAYLIESGVNFREGPSTECKSMGRLAKFSPVFITGETDEWYRVTSNDTEGYVSRDFVEIGKPVVYVSSQDVNLRAGPGTKYDLLTKVRQNSEFEIIGADGEWLKGIVNRNTGYIRADYLSAKEVNGGKKTNEFTDEEVKAAARVVYMEAKGYGMEAYRAVANVIYNRVKSHRFPNTVKGVIYEKGQFSVVNHSNFSHVSPSSDAVRATREVLNGGVRPLPFNVLYFHASYCGTHWGSEKSFYKTIGDNSFFRYVG